MDTVKIAAGVAMAAAVGVGIYCLSRDDMKVGTEGGGAMLDFERTHSIEVLLKLSEELELEHICIYTRVYNMMLKFKEAGTWRAEMLRALEAQVNEDIKMKTK